MFVNIISDCFDLQTNDLLISQLERMLNNKAQRHKTYKQTMDRIELLSVSVGQRDRGPPTRN